MLLLSDELPRRAGAEREAFLGFEDEGEEDFLDFREIMIARILDF